MSTEVLDRHTAFQLRIDRAKETVRHAEAACEALVFGDATLADLDAEGHVRRSVRTLLPLAVKNPSFDVTISLGADRSWGVRVHTVQERVEVTAVGGLRDESSLGLSDTVDPAGWTA